MASCPVKHEDAPHSSCPASTSSSETNPLNNMPKVAEQSTWPGQEEALGTNRVKSTIPKGDFTPAHQDNAEQSETWVYPSEQQFFNAMKRKGWKAQEQDMSTIVAIHNAVNERTWNEVLKWEKKFHCDDCQNPKLLKFIGRPKDLTPKARFMSWIGYTLPFDRHDWLVDRCGVQVRYVIDFYRGKNVNGAPAAFHIDARPALDSVGAAVDRMKMTISQFFS